MSNYPAISEEEEQSLLLAKNLMCLGCLAIAYQFHVRFSSSKVTLSDQDLIDISEKVCLEKSYLKYGIVGLDRNEGQLVGPGLDSWSGESLTLYSRRTSIRLSRMCKSFLDLPDDYDFPERVVYDHWLNFGHLQGLKYFLCSDPADSRRSFCL